LFFTNTLHFLALHFQLLLTLSDFLLNDLDLFPNLFLALSKLREAGLDFSEAFSLRNRCLKLIHLLE